MEGLKLLKIAALVKDLSISQSSFYLIKEFNKCISNTNISTGVFHIRSSTPPIQPLFGCKNVGFLGSYQGTVISTSIEDAGISLKTSSNSKKFLYIWDLDWIENPVFFSTAMSILRDNRLRIIARSSEHAKVIDNFCNKSVCGIVDNWNINQLLKIIEEKPCQIQ
jgi:hypothetical protein